MQKMQIKSLDVFITAGVITMGTVCVLVYCPLPLENTNLTNSYLAVLFL